MKSPLFFFLLFFFLSPMGFSQEKAKEDTLTASQKEEVIKADLIYKEMQENFEKDEFAKATPLAIEALKTYREILGNKHSKTHNTIIDLGRLYLNQKEYAKSEPLLIEALKLNREIEGDKHPDTANSIINLAALYFYQVQYAKAEPLYLEALQIRREVLGNKHPDTVTSISNLALLYSDQAQYAKAEPLYLEALKINREALGNKHPDTANSIIDLALFYSDQAQYAKVEPLYLEALKIRRGSLGIKHPDTVDSINSLAEFYNGKAQYAKAEPLFVEALKIRREALGNKHPDTATSIRKLGSFYMEQAQYAKAEPLYLEALKIRREALGDKHPDTTTIIDNLAVLFMEQDQNVKAEPLFVEALKIRREVLGNKHPDTAQSINNLATLYLKQAQYAKAEPLLVEALKIRREVLGNNHSYTATSINNLGGLYSDQGQYAKAEPLYLEALKIRREVLGNNHSSTAISINNLAMLYKDQAQYAKAEPLLFEALTINRFILGNKHPGTATSINNLGGLYSDQAQYAKAEPLFLEGLKINRESLGNKHPDTALSINNLAWLYYKQAQYAKAEPLFVEALKISTDHLLATATIQSVNAQILMTNKDKFFLDRFLYNALGNHTPSGGYDQVLSWKGMIYRRQNLLRALQGNDPLKKELSDTIRQLATLLNSTPKLNEEQAFQDKVKTLSEKKEDLEKELAKQIPSLNLSKITPSDLQNLIASDVALVDIFQYWHSSPPKEGQGKLDFEYRYAAWVIRKDKSIARLELGSAVDINNLVSQWRSSISTRKSPSGGPQDPALALREKVWLPIAKHLEGAKTVIISPDGLLGTLPFTALPGEDIKKYLIEERNIAVVPFLQTLPDLLAKKELAGKNLLAVGDVAYDAEPGSGSLLAKTALRSKTTLKWTPLEGTRAEMLAIRDSFEQKFPDAKSMQLRKAQATEEAFRQQAPKANFLHIATHGFFVEAAPLTTESKNSAKIDNPGLQSGLVLAGANQPIQAGLDDGILTASEVAELDLTGVEQAVLSACETGLGKSLAGEGLLGLQRAFQLAGARTVVASMWKVPDLATKELMTRYYENIWEKKMGKLEALREAQLWMLKEGKKRGIDAETVDTKDAPKPAVVETGNCMPPLYWGAWVLSGAWN